MALSPELKLLVSGAKAAANDDHDGMDDYEPSIREQLALIGLQKATKAELGEIIVNAMTREPDA